MNNMTLSEALTIRAAFNKMKQSLESAGVDTSGVRYITDLPPVLATLCNDDLGNLLDDLISDAGEENVVAMIEAFQAAAECGAMVEALGRPTDKVQEGDLYA